MFTKLDRIATALERIADHMDAMEARQKTICEKQAELQSTVPKTVEDMIKLFIPVKNKIDTGDNQ